MFYFRLLQENYFLAFGFDFAFFLDFDFTFLSIVSLALSILLLAVSASLETISKTSKPCFFNPSRASSNFLRFFLSDKIIAPAPTAAPTAAPAKLAIIAEFTFFPAVFSVAIFSSPPFPLGTENNLYNIKMSNLQTATFAGGCFWCFETLFKRLRGVEEVTSGFSGGKMENPSTEDVYYKNTGHAEAVQLKFNPEIISYKQLVEIFFRLHDPTTLNRQAYDVGEQYRSVIFYRSDSQKEIAEKEMKKFESEKIYKDPIVTEIVPFSSFYKAGEHNQNFYDQNRNSSYCKIIIDPKITKLYRDFKNLTRD